MTERRVAGLPRLLRVYRALVASWPWQDLADAYESRADASEWIRAKVAAFRAQVETSVTSRGLVTEIDRSAVATEQGAAFDVGRALRELGLPRLPTVDLSDLVTRRRVAAFRRENLKLIRTLARSEVASLRDLLVDAERRGARVETVRREIQDRLGVARRHADLLARDQTLKLSGQVTKARQTQSGIRRYKWSTSRDERVRPRHAELDGQIFEWSGDGPITDAKGNRHHPGGDFQCRCVAIPVLD